MRVIVHRSKVALYHGTANMLTLWHEYGFEPLPPTTEKRGSGSIVRHPAEPIPIEAPVGSVLSAVTDTHRGVLSTYFNPMGLDPQSVYHLAAKADRGFRFAEMLDDQVVTALPERDNTPAAETPYTDMVTYRALGPEPAPKVALPQVDKTLPAFQSPHGWGISFAFDFEGHRSWLDRGCLTGPEIRSTNVLARIASWPTAEAATEWLEGSGLDCVTIPVGVGMLAGVEPIWPDPHGVQFSFVKQARRAKRVRAATPPSPPVVPEPAPERPVAVGPSTQLTLF